MSCDHLRHLVAVEPTSPTGCERCLATGMSWVSLRLCMSCGHVGCCDSSPGQHATGHHNDTGHPVVQSFQPGDAWAYCYEDDAFVERISPALVRSVAR